MLQKWGNAIKWEVRMSRIADSGMDASLTGLIIIIIIIFFLQILLVQD